MTRAFVCGCLGTTLTADEKAFLRDAEPLGVILFGVVGGVLRNIESPAQVYALTSEIRATLGRDVLILVDQEGGRVQRLRPPHWRRYPAAARFSSIADPAARARAVRLAARLMAEDLLAVGIDVDCLPVLDVPVEGAHDVIGDRAYARDPIAVATLGRAAAEGMLDAGVLPVMKHLPGHGRAFADSHLALPVVEAPLAALEASDFLPFERNADLPAAMTGHVVYTALDAARPATISPTVVQGTIRRKIGFDGLLFSDDLSMKALPGTFREKAEGLFTAGVDVALHCNGLLAEAEAVAAVAPPVEGACATRLARARAAMKRPRPDFDPVDAVAMLDRVLATTA